MPGNLLAGTVEHVLIQKVHFLATVHPSILGKHVRSLDFANRNLARMELPVATQPQMTATNANANMDLREDIAKLNFLVNQAHVKIMLLVFPVEKTLLVTVRSRYSLVGFVKS